MKSEYLAYLKCPGCGSEDLSLKSSLTVKERVREGEILCGNCRATYAIRNFIPRFSGGIAYADTFGPQWNAFAKSQIDDEKIKESAIRFDSELGWSQGELEGRVIAEFGSGAGRFVDIASRRQAGLVVGIDATDAVDAAQENLSDRANVLFIQADIFKNPLRDGAFDFAYSIGVLHHTPDPEAAFAKMLGAVKVGGLVGLSLYEVSNYHRPNRNSVKVSTLDLFWALNQWRMDFFRMLTTRVPEPAFLLYCKAVIPVLHILNKIPIVKYVRYLLPSTCYGKLPLMNSMVDTHDTYATKIVHQYRGEDVFQWFLHEGLAEIILRNCRAGWVSITACVPPMAERLGRKMFLRQPGPPGTTESMA